MTIDPTELARLKLAAETKLHYLKRASGIVSGLMSVRPEQVLALIAEVERLKAELASARELSEAERAVVEAAIGEEINGVLASNSKDPFLRERFRKTAIQSGHALGRAVRQVLALRAKKAGE